MSLKKALLAATVLAMPLAAQAQSYQPVTGLYVGAGAGLNLIAPKASLKPEGDFAGSPSGHASFNPGWAGVVSLGWGFGNGVRAEIEGNYRDNDVDKLSGFGVPITHSAGKVRSYGAMANAYYDFYGLGLPVVPYIGLGAGYVWNDYDNVRATSFGNTARIDGNDGAFAYQGILGVAYPIDSVPGLALTGEYRFLGTLNTKIDGVGDTGDRGSFKTQSYNHSILVGLRYAFNTPAPAVAPAPAPAPVVTPAPAPARTYLVFFDFDSAQLTDRARQITSEAAENSKRVQVTRIEVSGHADRSGTPQYNQALSLRRANAVAAELERLGVSRSSMSIQAFGESRPLVPTADGVREPQNRRVEIVLR
ncbi:OmpA family protein [Acetobacteraceae bacterium H6797]|nr:OmpA family protein [Acetobacteraceae bacterium H6797]